MKRGGREDEVKTGKATDPGILFCFSACPAVLLCLLFENFFFLLAASLLVLTHSAMG